MSEKSARRRWESYGAVRRCQCRQCRGGICGVETWRSTPDGEPRCLACAMGEHRPAEYGA